MRFLFFCLASLLCASCYAEEAQAHVYVPFWPVFFHGGRSDGLTGFVTTTRELSPAESAALAKQLREDAFKIGLDGSLTVMDDIYNDYEAVANLCNNAGIHADAEEPLIIVKEIDRWHDPVIRRRRLHGDHSDIAPKEPPSNDQERAPPREPRKK